MRKSVSVFAGLAVCAFTAGNLAVSVSAAAAPAGVVPKSTASPANASPDTASGWTERPTTFQPEPQKVDLATLPRAQHAKGAAATLPLHVRDQQAYAAGKAHPDAKPGLAITHGSTSSPATTTGPKVPITVGPNFPGMSSATDFQVVGHGDEPPDTQIAVGSTRIVEMVNEVMQIYDKSGNPIANTSTSLDQFFLVNSHWTPTYFSSEHFVVADPRVLYDATSGHWFASLLAYGPSTFNSLTLLAASQTSDPAGNWWIYPADGEGPALGGPPLICDQPKVGVSSDKIVIGCSLFDMTPTFTEGLLMVMSKSRAVAGLSLHETEFVNASWFGMVPAQNMTAAVATAYVAFNRSNGGSGVASAGVIVLTGNPSLTPPPAIGVVENDVNMNFTSFPPNAPQNGSADLIDTGDDRFMSAFVEKGKLFTSGPDSCTPAGDNAVRSCLRLVEINLSTYQLIQGATAGIVGKYVIAPTLGVNSSGDVALAYSTSSSSDYPDVENAVQPAGDPNTFVGGQVVAGSGPYVHSSPQSPARWGDYSSVAMDPSSTSYVWVAGEFSNGPSDGTGGTQWATQIARFNAHTPVCTATSLTPSVLSPQEPTADITLTAAATCLDPATPDFQFWITTPGTTTFAMAQDYGNGNTYDWASHVTLGTYTLEVRVRGTTETAKAYDTLIDIPYTITTTPCTLPTLDASPADYPQPTGTSVTLTASTTCGAPPPLYQFLVRTPDLLWHVGQAYSASNVYNWNAFNTQVGNYLLQVRVKNTGSLGAYDNLRSISYSLALCNIPSLDTGAATSPYISGSGAITLTANGACHGTIQYQFLYRDTALVYHVIAGYGSSNTATWNADYKAGNYLLQVRTRPLGSTAAYITYTNLAFTLSGCGVPSLTPDLASPQFAATAVTWTAAATCSGTPQYKFLVRLPSLVWTLGQDWGGDTFAWSSHATLGTYIVEVLVRNTGANEDAGDNLKTAAYTIGICSAISLDTGAASSPYASGSGPITLTASGACHGTIQYQFLYRDTALVYHVIAGYGSSNTATWNADYKAGNYLLQVRTRPLGSTAAYITYTNLAFTLSGCGVPSLMPDLASPQLGDTTITWTAAATCSGTPQYKFMVHSSFCGAPTNPWQYTFCGISLIYRPPSTFCTYFSCISSFWTSTSGYVVQCADGKFSHSGGVTGACSGHGGVLRTLHAGFWTTPQDWGASDTLVWAPHYTGPYVVEVLARNTGANEDAGDNLKTAAYTIGICSAISLDTGAASSPYASGSGAITLTANGTCLGTIQYQFLYRDTALVYHVIAGYGSSNTATWNADYKAGNYLLQVRTRPLGSTAAYITYTNLAFTLSGCGVPSLIPDLASPQFAATPVTWTAAATCSGTPQYKFLVRLPSLVWTLGQDWSASNTFAWSSHTTLGAYIVEVLVRNSGANEDAGDNLKTAAYTIGICSAISLDTGAASSPYASGSGAITLTASGACHGTIQYQFLYRDTALVYHVIAGYGSSNTATWNADYKAGNYLLQVRTRPLGSIAAYITYTNLAFTLSGCGVPTLTPDLASSKVAGTTITWTAAATCSGTPQYKFLVRSPAGVWSLKQNWGTSDTYVWQSPSTVGTYLVEVLARNSGADEDAGDNIKIVSYVLK